MKKLISSNFIWVLQVLSIFLVCTVSSLTVASSSDCNDPKAAAYGTPDVDMDGFFMGANGCLYDPRLVLSEDVPVVGGEYDSGQELLFVINGAKTRSNHNDVRLRSVAMVKERPVIGIFNAPYDTALEENFKYVDRENKVAMTVRAEAYRRVMDGRRFAVIALSQSGFMAGRGLSRLSSDLFSAFPLRRFYRQKLLGRVDVETVGTIGLHYPDGPNYVHYVNKRDLAPLIAGVMATGAEPGRGSVIATFFYENENCLFGMLPMDQYPGDGAELSTGLRPKMGPSVHSICSYAASGFAFESLRAFAPRWGHAVVPLELE
jgi:hypothetical protein